jgi:hypothetical protein
VQAVGSTKPISDAMLKAIAIVATIAKVLFLIVPPKQKKQLHQLVIPANRRF